MNLRACKVILCLQEVPAGGEKMEGCQHEWEEFISGKREELYGGPFRIKRFLKCKRCGMEKIIAEGVIREEGRRWVVYGLEEKVDTWEEGALPDEIPRRW